MEMFILCYVFGQLSSVRNLCYSKISVVMLLGYRIAAISRKIESERKNMPYAQMLHIKTVVELSNLQLGKYKSRNKFCKHQMGVFKNEKKKITCALYGLLKNAYKFFS